MAQDDEGSLYISDRAKGEVIKLPINETVGQVIISKLNRPYLIFLDRNQSLYVTDRDNHQVVKLEFGATQISVVAGESGGGGGGMNQLQGPESVFVDEFETLYIADSYNHRIIRWLRGAKSGSVIAGGRGQGSNLDQFNLPTDVSFDLDGNLYVTDHYNHRVLKFPIDKSSC
ncbi:unnamed protein product [Rotaria sp. Silwood1]|nr:unnamed protein product [Rotaria sp. Silwood1]